MGERQRIAFVPEESRRRMRATVDAAFPLHRSITGNGVRATLQLVRETLPMTVHEVPSGTGVLDWTVPKEWNVRDAYVADEAGQRVVDVSASNLHLVSYSVPVRQQVSLVKLQEHLFTDAARRELGSRLAEAARESHSMDRGVAAYAETYRRALARRRR